MPQMQSRMDVSLELEVYQSTSPLVDPGGFL